MKYEHALDCPAQSGLMCNCPAGKLNTAEYAKEMQQRYRNTFGTSEGAKVLGDIATLGHVFDTIAPDDVAKVAERNFALVIMQMAGGFDSLYPQLGIGSSREVK